VAIDDAVAASLSDRFELRRSEGVAWVVGEHARPFGTVVGVSTPCVGRERELSTLLSFWDECVNEPRARPVIVTGPPGTGKSRLAYEAIARIRERSDDAEIWLASCGTSSAGSPLRPLKDALKHTAGIQEGEPPDDQRRKLRDRVGEGDDRIVHFLGEMLGVPFSSEESVQLAAARADARLMADQIRRAWQDFVLAECARRPVLLVLEDLHWGDPSTVSFVDRVLCLMEDRPFMVLALARPEIERSFPRLWRERDVQELKVGTLPRRACEHVTRMVLGSSSDPEAIGRVVSRAMGNAFLLEELIRAEAAGRPASSPAPVLAVVEARLAQLEPEQRRVLRAASVLGRIFWCGAVASMIGQRNVDESLSGLVDKELLQLRPESRFPGVREYAFRHDLVREAAYGMLLDADRTLGHRLAAEWLDAAAERDALVVAEHWRRGEDLPRAAIAFLRAAHDAWEGDDLAAVLAHAQQSFACGADGEHLAELRMVVGEASLWLGKSAELEAQARQALASLPRASGHWYRAARLASAASQRLGSREHLLEVAEQVFHAEDAMTEARADALSALAMFLFLAGERATCERFLAILDPSALGGLARSRVLLARGMLASVDGDHDEALAAFDAVATLYEGVGDRRRACLHLVNTAFAHLQVGDTEIAGELLHRARVDAERMGLRYVVGLAFQNLARVEHYEGRWKDAVDAANRSVAEMAAQGNRGMEGASRGYLSAIHLSRGDVDRALVEGRRAVELIALEAGELPVALGALARAELAHGNVAAARAAAEHAMRALSRASEERVTIRGVYAEVLWASGEHEAAREAIGAARDALETTVQRLSDPARRERCLTRVPGHARVLELAREWLAG
jgi:tetratricopeptide (TPR) repeat protein